jgi:hypothetical protein
MRIHRKIVVVLGLASVVTLIALTSMAPDKPGFKNLKVLPKNIPHEKLHQVMDEWANSLGVHCGFCHAPNAAGKGLDFASDAKPEKEMARHMYKMMNKINQKYFEAKKDSLGMVMEAGINCNTCHHGASHPELKVPEDEKHGPGGPPPGAGGPPPGAPPKQ